MSRGRARFTSQPSRSHDCNSGCCCATRRLRKATVKTRTDEAPPTTARDALLLSIIRTMCGVSFGPRFSTDAGRGRAERVEPNEWDLRLEVLTASERSRASANELDPIGAASLRFVSPPCPSLCREGCNALRPRSSHRMARFPRFFEPTSLSLFSISFPRYFPTYAPQR